MRELAIKITDISYFASADVSTGHYWMHESFRILIGPSNYEIFTRTQKSELGNLSSLGYENGVTSFTKWLAKREASKVIRSSAFAYEDEHLFYFFEGGAFELLVCAELAKKIEKGMIWFNFHEARFWGEALQRPDRFPGLAELLSDSRVRDRVVFSAESIELASGLSETFQFECHLYPLFTTILEQLGKERVEPPAWVNREVELLIIVGDFQMAGIVGEYVSAARSHLGESKQIHVHWSGRDFDGEGHLRTKNVTESYGAISPEEYASQLLRSKFVLLLYPKKRYELSSSGRIEDAILMGCIPIVPRNTALQSQNGRDIPSFLTPADVLDTLESFAGPKHSPLVAEEALAEIRSLALGTPRVLPPKKVKLDGQSKLRMPNPIRHKRKVDRLSIWRIRLGVSEELVRLPRLLYRRLRWVWK